MSSPAPAVAQPDIGGGDVVALPLSPPAPSPVNDDIISPPAPIVPSPLPSSSPPENIGILPSPLAAPPLSLVPPVTSTPPATSPVSSQTQPQKPVTQPQKPETNPPSSSPTPTPKTENKPPKEKLNPPSFFPPVDKPVSTTPPPLETPPSIRSNPVSPSPPLDHPPDAPSRSSYRRHGAGPYVTEPSPTPRPKPTASPLATPPKSSSLPTSVVLPSPPPVALPVPQAPDGGAWFPFTAVPPAPLPTFPGPPSGVNSPATPLLGNNNGDSPGNNQNIVASPGSSGRSNGSSSTFVVGLAVAGILVVLLGAVSAILVVFCRKREKKFGDGQKSASYKHGSTFSGFQDKSSLPQYTKEGSNIQGNQQVLVNVAAPKGPNSNTNGPILAIEGPSPVVGPIISSGTFTYEELAGATNGFSEQNLLGQGGFGYVLKGVLPNGKQVAVKQLKMGGQQAEREFHAEVETISQVHHKHLVSLIGYCISGAERLLVYEFVPNNTLEFHLHGQGQPVMDWPTRLKIAIGSAKGLAYLHEDCSPTIIHRDIKAANILLDYNFEAKVSDFGLAKIFTSSNSSVTHITTRVVGTFGYLAPEYASSGKVTDKSDVYSYGVMLLELITGRPPICSFGSSSNGSLVNWARPLLTQAIGDGNYDTLADPRLEKNYNVDQMASMVACAAACVRLSAWRRPRLSQVVRALEGDLSASDLDDGTRPGDSSMHHFPYENLDFDARNYIENLKRMAMESNNEYSTSRYSDNTSEYGLIPSASSTETY